MGKYCFGIDVGGTTVKMGYFDIQGNLFDKWEINTNTENYGENILPDIADSVSKKISEQNLNKSDIVGIGIGVPGAVNKKGIVDKSANLGWEKLNLNESLRALLDIPVKGINDANAAALGEMWCGGGKGHDNLVVVTLGTGVGGGIIVDGEILCGIKGQGGEIGHMHIESNELEQCGCGSYGCLEQYASATGIVRLAKRKLSKTNLDTVLTIDSLTAKDLWDAVKQGDLVAIEIAKQFGEYIGKGLARTAIIVDPELILIGGGVSKAGDILLDYIKEPYQRYAFEGNRDADFKLATLGNDAGIYGAARLVLDV